MGHGNIIAVSLFVSAGMGCISYMLSIDRTSVRRYFTYARVRNRLDLVEERTDMSSELEIWCTFRRMMADDGIHPE